MSVAKYVLLDRDGVINHDSDDFIKSAEEWLPINGSLEAIALFTQHHYQVIIITNQSGVGRGHYTETTLTAIHRKMSRLTEALGGKIAHIYVESLSQECYYNLVKIAKQLLMIFILLVIHYGILKRDLPQELSRY